MVGTIDLMRACTPGRVRRGWGSVVNIASMAGKDTNPNICSALKAAVVGVTWSVGKEFARSGVLVNAIIDPWIHKTLARGERGSAACPGWLRADSPPPAAFESRGCGCGNRLAPTPHLHWQLVS